MKRPVSLFCSLTCHCFSHEDLLEKVSEHDLIHIIFNIFQQLWFLVINQRKHLWIEIWFLLFTEPSSKAKPRGKELSHILCAAGRARTWRERWVMEPLQRHFPLQPICEREDWTLLVFHHLKRNVWDDQRSWVHVEPDCCRAKIISRESLRFLICFGILVLVWFKVYLWEIQNVSQLALLLNPTLIKQISKHLTLKKKKNTGSTSVTFFSSVFFRPF